MPELPISSVASVRAGYPFRSRVENDPRGEVTLIQMRDIDYGTLRMLETPYQISGVKPKGEHLLTKGDVLLVSRGTNNVAVHLDEISGETIAAQSFFVIRTHRTDLLPAYLAWFLNSASAQKYFRAQSSGGGMPHLTRRTVEELTISLPPIETQRRIIELHRLSTAERDLVDEIHRKRVLLLEAYAKTSAHQ